MINVPYYTPEGLLRVQLRLITEDELAAALDVKVETLRVWRGERQGPSWTKLGKAVFYRLRDVRDWIDGNVVHAEVKACSTK